MKSAEYDQRRLATLLTAVNESVSQGAMDLKSTIDIWDATGTKHTVTVSDFKAAVPGYLCACQQQEGELDVYATSIRDATSQAELDAITFLGRT
jgi:hypothetical protein